MFGFLRRRRRVGRHALGAAAGNAPSRTSVAALWSPTAVGKAVATARSAVMSGIPDMPFAAVLPPVPAAATVPPIPAAAVLPPAPAEVTLPSVPAAFALPPVPVAPPLPPEPAVVTLPPARSAAAALPQVPPRLLEPPAAKLPLIPPPVFAMPLVPQPVFAMAVGGLAPASPRVQLGFRDGSSTSLDPLSSQSLALEQLAESLSQRD